ncbi:DUF167 family protein [Erythrobacter cryptus]|uniref:DUF167 family protein n=1 Tax=Erythrobacter cryptus TaxID=196588 RepID=UPI0004197E5B|nr:DUF167 family protein [Erythrobacter cryptus]GIX20843.1 MAG: hypothetical protein KatS3mg120_2519 [Erythrobacter sp.]
MARAPAQLPDSEALRARFDPAGRLAVKVTPGAREESVTLTDEAVLVKVRAPADRGAANAAVLALLARALDVAPSRLTLERGGASRHKLVRLLPA